MVFMSEFVIPPDKEIEIEFDPSQRWEKEYDEEYEYGFGLQRERKRGGRKRSPESKTPAVAREKDIQQAIENRKMEARQRIRVVCQNLPFYPDAEETYLDWLRKSLKDDQVVMEEKDLRFEFSRSGVKAGGQNVNKVNSSVRCYHLITNLRVENEETRDQSKNKKRTKELMLERLKEHLKDWRVLLQNRENKITQTGLDSLPDLLIELLP